MLRIPSAVALRVRPEGRSQEVRVTVIYKLFEPKLFDPKLVERGSRSASSGGTSTYSKDNG